MLLRNKHLGEHVSDSVLHLPSTVVVPKQPSTLWKQVAIVLAIFVLVQHYYFSTPHTTEVQKECDETTTTQLGDPVRPTANLFQSIPTKRASKDSPSKQFKHEPLAKIPSNEIVHVTGLSPPVPFPKHKCHYSIFVGIITSFEDIYVARRAVIRRTYMTKYADRIIPYSKAVQAATCFPHDTAIYAFFISSRGNATDRQITADENEIYNDIVELDVSDAYLDLTQKVSQMFRFAYTVNYNDFKTTHFLKIDDDSYLRVPHFLNLIRNLATQRLYWGYIFGKTSGIITNRSLGKAGNLRWIAGAGYILSMDLVQWMMWTNSTIPLVMTKNEDQSIGIWTYPLNITLADAGKTLIQTLRGKPCYSDSVLLHLQYMTAKDWDAVFKDDDEANEKWCKWPLMGKPPPRDRDRNRFQMPNVGIKPAPVDNSKKDNSKQVDSKKESSWKSESIAELESFADLVPEEELNALKERERKLEDFMEELAKLKQI